MGRPNIGDRGRLRRRIDDLLDRRWLTNYGPYVEELERRLSDLTGARHCVAMCNATAALEILVKATGLTGEVIVPSFTFVATAHALQWLGVTPVFADVDARSHTLDPAEVERLVTPRTTGIIGVHLWGRACDVDALTATAARHNLTLIFDAAHAVACSRRGRMVGTFGRAEVFSFHATKIVNSFEGGAVTTNDDALAATLRLMQNFGFAAYDEVVGVGTNAKMNEASAAMALTSLESLDDFVAVNARNHRCYARELTGTPGIRVLAYEETERSNYQYVVLEVDDTAFGIERDDLQRILWAEQVLARRYFYPGCHRVEPYRSTPPPGGWHLPTTEGLCARVLCLPTGTAVDPAHVATISAIIRTVGRHADEIRHRLRRDASVPMPSAGPE